MRRTGRLLCSGLALFAASAAADSLPADTQVHAFFSQGWVLTSGGNDVAGSSDDANGSARYQEFGVNGSWRPHATLLLSGQAASIRNGAAADDYLDLDYLLLDYTPFQGESGRLGARVGKLKLPIGLYNDSRDAVFTRPGVLMPQGIYLDTSGGREFGYFSEYGGGLYADLNAGSKHAIQFEGVGLVKQPLGDRADIAILRTLASGRFWMDHGVVTRLMDEYDGGRARAAVSLAKVKIEYDANGSTFVFPTNLFTQNGTLDFEQAVGSLQYNWPIFSLTAEYVWRVFHLSELTPIPGASKSDLRPSGGYLQGTLRESDQLSTYVRYDEEIRDANDRWGTAQATRFGQPAYYFYARDWTAGSRYDWSKNVSTWMEFHYIEGDAWLNPLDNPGAFAFGTPAPADKYWTLFTVMLSYRF